MHWKSWNSVIYSELYDVAKEPLKAVHCNFFNGSDVFNNWGLLLHVHNDNMSWVLIKNGSQCHHLLCGWMSRVLAEYFNMHNTLSNSENIRTQRCVKCGTGTSRPNVSLSGDQLKSPTQEEKPVLWVESEPVPEVQGQHWIQSLINHESVNSKIPEPSRVLLLLGKAQFSAETETSGLQLSCHVPAEPWKWRTQQRPRKQSGCSYVRISSENQISFSRRRMELAVRVSVMVAVRVGADTVSLSIWIACLLADFSDNRQVKSGMLLCLHIFLPAGSCHTGRLE